MNSETGFTKICVEISIMHSNLHQSFLLDLSFNFLELYSKAAN